MPMDNQYHKQLPAIIVSQLKKAGDYGIFIKSIINYTNALNNSYSALREKENYIAVLHHQRMLCDVIFKCYSLYVADSKDTLLKRFIEDKRIDNQTYQGKQLTNGVIKQLLAERYKGIDVLYDECNKYIHPSIFFYKPQKRNDSTYLFTNDDNKQDIGLYLIYMFDTLNNILSEVIMEIWNGLVVPKYEVQAITPRDPHYPLYFSFEAYTEYVKWKMNSKRIRSTRKNNIKPY